MSHVLDDLELHATGALPPDLSAGVAAHLERCAECRVAAAEIAEIVGLLADAVPPREPPADLRQRILVAARAEVAPTPRRSFADLFRARLTGLAMPAAIGLVLLLGANTAMRIQESQGQLALYEAQLARISHADRSWYMAGVEPWTGTGGTLVVQSNDSRPFVLFHDLRPLPEGQLYTVWLIEPDGGWTRGTSFGADGNKYQLVDVGHELAGFEQCAVTVEASETGKRQGPIVMQSRIAPPSE
ncbi:MAG: anti-sigma factor domain-containing protein [Candidatus Limnocylindria bacterium]